MYRNKTFTTQFQLPRDTTMAGGFGSGGYYRREVCGSLFLGALFINADGIATYNITWLNMDARMYGLITDPRM